MDTNLSIPGKCFQLFFGLGLFLFFGAAVSGGASPDFSAFGSLIAFTHETVSFLISVSI
jgi:hypothetical protein